MPLSAGQEGTTTDRHLNKLQYAVANKAADLGTPAAGDKILVHDASANYEPKYMDVPIGAAPAARFISTTSSTVALTATEHGERTLLVNTNASGTSTVTLPAATGSGFKYTVRNNIAQTQGTIVVAALTTDIFKGKAIMLDTTAAADAMVFRTTATSDKISWNRTTQGGIGEDEIVAQDVAAGVWLVDAYCVGSGSLQTPWSET